ncbi:MAG: ABC transporter permease [Butyrivibrio sp.]|nr:ABC transporter permease [Butyrivibrio sp.]
MGKLDEYIKSAIKQMKHNGYRTLMTMLGIVIGIAAVIAVVALGNGMKQYVKDQINGIAGNYGYVYIDTSKTTEFFTPEDITILKEALPDLKGISPNDYGEGKVKGPRATVLTSIQSGSEALDYAFGNKLIKGSYFTEQQVETGQRVCVMTQNDAKKLFGTDECIGKEIELSVAGKSAVYSVVGIRENTNELYDFFTQDMDYAAMLEVPYTSFASDYGYDIGKWYNLLLFAEQDILTKRCEEAQTVLTNAHGLRGADAISAYSMADMTEEIDTIMGGASKFLILVAFISLVVGGIGIMNIMLVSVTERTREIGIRKSIGAKTGAITMQFLTEAAILTLSGGVLGIILGIFISKLLCKMIAMPLIIPIQSVLGAAFFSIMVGIVFGLYPARKAAKMKPIDALRV